MTMDCSWTNLFSEVPLDITSLAKVSLANLLWAAALAQLSPADVQQLLKSHDHTLREAKRVELVRLLWALGREEREEWDETGTCGLFDI